MKTETYKVCIYINLVYIHPSSQQHAAWIIPFFCYQIFDFALNTLVAISVMVYPNTIQDYLEQLVWDFNNLWPFNNLFLLLTRCGVSCSNAYVLTAWDLSIQRGLNVHQQHMPSVCSTYFHRLYSGF